MSERFDLILEGGTVVDGTGRPRFPADVGIIGDRISGVGVLTDAEAERRIDVAGQCVAPGFIDVHTHSDLAPFLPDQHRDLQLATVRQGVTTEICGNCGFSVFPNSESRTDDVDRYLQVVLGPTAHGRSTLDDYGAELSERHLATNVGTLVGHGTLRAGVMGFERREPTPDEVRQLHGALANACGQGALGFSSGLIYAPGVYAQTPELVTLARVAAEHGLPYVTHMRDEADNIDQALEEALHIGAESGAPVQISHHKTAGHKNFGRTKATLPLLERAREQGIDVMIDVYPYTSGSTILAAVLPPWASEGGVEQMLARLEQNECRERLRTDLEHGLPGWQRLVGPDEWSAVVVATSPANQSYEGIDVATLAEEAGQSGLEFVCDLLLAEDAQVTIVLHLMDEADVQRVIASPLSIIGSDGVPLPGKPHPRWAGTFVRILGEYVRNRSLLTLEQAVHKMTFASAERFGLTGRGVIKEGASADLVVFDPDTVGDLATYDQPLTAPAGVSHVLVNGVVSVESGAHTGAFAGRFLRR
jgi:N-acyl-D-aspartate/D-glutamate deacylase